MPDDQQQIIAEISSLTTSVKLLTDRVDHLIQLNRDIIKWLLIVVCVIAVGRGSIDLLKDFYKNDVAGVMVER
jgi:hypothetical protein